MTRFCIILGAMKSGTTSLFNYLAQHPQIAPCREKEPSFFSHHYKKGINWYLSLWENQNMNNQVLLEASMNYTKYPSFASSSKNIIDFSERHDVSLKFIYVMRDPIKRIESQYTYSFARWTDQTMEENLNNSNHLIDVSRYAQQLDHYFDHFDSEKFLLIDFEDVINQPDKILKEICTFLEIDSRFQFSNLKDVHNKSEGITITKPVDRLYHKYPLLKSLAKVFPKKFKILVSKLLFRKKIDRKFTLTEKQRQMTHNALKGDMERLHKKYGINVKKWGF